MNHAIVSDSTSHALPVCPANAAAYAFLRHTGFILDELSAQGLVLWTDDNDRWQWYWKGTDLKSTQGFWAMGGALVDGVISRFPETFSTNQAFDTPGGFSNHYASE
ncbi:MAG: hypothetical protein DWQ04_10730 [Chloroflexi bacterium]|nr:MAG: hypothetical protein DWQ04_10730 [Chloroflexota bacterium]